MGGIALTRTADERLVRAASSPDAALLTDPYGSVSMTYAYTFSAVDCE